MLPFPQVQIGVGWSTAGPHRYALRLEEVGTVEDENIMSQNEVKYL